MKKKVMIKKICIITTSEENFFTPDFLKYCLAKKKLKIEIVFIPGFFKFEKDFLYDFQC